MRVRKQIVWCGVMAAALWPRLGHAQTIEERIKIIEDKMSQQQTAASQAVGIDMHALMMVDYNANFNNPGTDGPSQGNIGGTFVNGFNYKSNTFDVRDAAIFLGRNKDDESFGFNLNVDFGTTANVEQARWGNGANDSKENLCGNGGDCFVEVREAFITYKTPLTIPGANAPISLKGGKFVTLLGYEIIPTYSAFNPNISTDMLFNLAVPYTNTGLLAHVPIIDQVALDAGIVNGWDNVADNNNEKTFMGGLGITPSDAISIYIAGTYGGESNPIANGGDGAGSQRGVMTANASWKVIDQLTLAVDSAYGSQTSSTVPGKTGHHTANWYGMAGYAIVTPMDKMQLALRAEWFEDQDGTQTGVAQTMWELTPTFQYALADHLTFRTEYRHNESNKNYFTTGSGTAAVPGTAPGQDLIFTELIFAL